MVVYLLKVRSSTSRQIILTITIHLKTLRKNLLAVNFRRPTIIISHISVTFPKMFDNTGVRNLGP